ncbi:hypothetical protein COOONC_08476 [Cooperia oncophora]
MACVDALTDITTLYLEKVASWVQECAVHAGRSEPSITDVGTAFTLMKISERELYEYMRQVRSVVEYEAAPKFPVRIRKSNYSINIHSPPKELHSVEKEDHLASDQETSGL